MEFKIRKATLKDIPAIVKLATIVTDSSIPPTRDTPLETVKKFRERDLNNLDKIFDMPQIGIFVAETDGGEFAGHVMGYNGEVESVTGELQGWIFDLAVEEKFRKQGLGSKLIEYFSEFSKKAGMKYVGLLVTSSNVPAINLYKKIGFKEERKRMAKKLF